MVVTQIELLSGYALHSTEKDVTKQHPISDGSSLVAKLELQDDKFVAIYFHFVCTRVNTYVCTYVTM
jgi:hypothetical protein